MDEFDPKEVPIPESWSDDAKAMVRFLLKRLDMVEKENRELRSRLDRNSSNSHHPPSQDPPWKKRGRRRRPTGKKRGGQPGHPGRNRSMVPREQVSRFESVRPTSCAVCGEDLGQDSPLISVLRFQQVELPPIKPDVTEFQLHGCGCLACGHTTQASPPPEFGNRCVGPRLQSLMAYLTGRMRLSRRMTGELLETLLGPAGRLSLGCISECEEDMARALATPYTEALDALCKSPAVNADETGWRMMGDTAWLWVAANEAISAFRIDASRGSKAFMRLLQGFDGILVSDRWSAYQKTPIALRQLCWAHLKRDFQKLVDRKAGAEKTGAWALREIETIFGMWHVFLDGEIPHSNLIQEFSNIKARFARLLRLGTRSKDVKARAFCQKLLIAWPALWTFLRHGGTVEPTNNRAERALRPAVIWRKLSFGSQSDRGRQFVERILTTMTSLRQQGRQVLEFLAHALTSCRTGRAAPSLLPVPGG